MVEHGDNYLRLVKHKQFLDEVEKRIRIANRDIINAHIQAMDRDTFLASAVGADRLRARYFESSLKLFRDHGDNWSSEGAISGPRQARECLHAFDALHRAIEQGYVDLAGYRPTKDGQSRPWRAFRETRL